LADSLTFTVYSREYCHLCEEMIAGLRELQARFHFVMVVTDVDADPALAERYGEHVPVLAHGERELCRYVLDSGAVTAHLAKFR
jgi:glutathione S-transferase